MALHSSRSRRGGLAMHLASAALLLHTGFASGANPVLDWNDLLLESIRIEATPPPLAARNLAMLHGAVYDAVNSISRTGDPYLGAVDAAPGASAEAAATAAAYHCAINLFPSETALFDEEYDAFLAATPASPSRDAGLWVGESAALAMLNWRGADGSSTSVPYVPATDPGRWRRTLPFFRPPDLPQWPYVTPFVLADGAQFRPKGPPALGSAGYARDFQLTRDYGSAQSAVRTPEQTLIARFWSDFSYTVTPPGHWNQIAASVAVERELGLPECARLMALLNLALADAGIVCWDAKYTYDFWRPVTAIRAADTDGNTDTDADPAWTPLLTTPSFPEYMSGHSTFSAAAATVLAAFFGTDHVRFTAVSDTVSGVSRTYDSFEAAAEEIGMSRIYGGIHFLSADLDGLAAGRQVGQYVAARALLPLHPPATLRLAAPDAQGRATLSVIAGLGDILVLESAADLEHWTAERTNAAPFTVDLDVVPGGRRFFRARLQVP